MNFPDALNGILKEPVDTSLYAKRDSWEQGKQIRVMKEGHLYPVHLAIFSSAGCQPYTPSHEDIIATDWTVDKYLNTRQMTELVIAYKKKEAKP